MRDSVKANSLMNIDLYKEMHLTVMIKLKSLEKFLKKPLILSQRI